MEATRTSLRARVRHLVLGLAALLLTATACAGQGHPNLPFPTLGGKQLWADEYVNCGWRIQRNHYTGHHRLLDTNDTRWAWGSYEACLASFEEERVERGLRPKSDHAVVLVHGLVRSKDSLAGLSRALEAAGYEVVPFDYPSARGSIEAHAAQLERVLDRLEGTRRVSFVTHSLGGPVVRTALARPKAAWRTRTDVDRLVMIFPPSQGSYQAESWGDNPLYRFFTGEAGQDLRPGPAKSMPQPSCPFAIVAGGRGDGAGRNASIPGDDDGTVSVEEAWLPGADAFHVFDVGHTFGMNDAEVVETTVRYLKTGE